MCYILCTELKLRQVSKLQNKNILLVITTEIKTKIIKIRYHLCCGLLTHLFVQYKLKILMIIMDPFAFKKKSRSKILKNFFSCHFADDR